MRSYGTFKCPELTRGKKVCSFGCTWNHPVCHMYKQNRCYWQHSKYCEKGWHFTEKYADHKKEDGAKRSHLQEKPRTPEPEETETKRIRCDRSGGEEADLQIALFKLKLGTSLPDDATLENAYRERMTEIANIVPGEELPDKCNDLTQAFRLVKSHLGLL